MKKLLSIVLAVVMALSAVSVIALAADDYADFDGTISLGETRPVNLPGLTQYSKYVFIRFIPENDGWYAISSDSRGNDDCDPYVELYTNLNGTYVAKNDDADSETNEFYLEYYFEAGTTYYFAMGNYRNATVWDITLECLHAVYEADECASCGAKCDHEKIDNMFDSCPCGKTYDGEVLALEEGKYEADVKCEADEDTFIKFAPTETGIFRAQSDNSKNTDADPCCDVYDSQGNLVAYHDDISSADYDFDLVYQFEVGKVYFVALYDNQAGKEWSFTFTDISTHSFEIEVPAEEEEPTTPEEDAGAAIISEDDTNTETGDDTNTETGEGDTTTPEETPTTETVVHKLTFVPQVDATCMNDGYTGYAYCAECDNCGETVDCGECDKYQNIGGYEIKMYDHVFDDDGNCMTDGCDAVDPVLSCTHMCHSTGIMGTIWSIVKFFTLIFNYRDGQFCDCGQAHY